MHTTKLIYPHGISVHNSPSCLFRNPSSQGQNPSHHVDNNLDYLYSLNPRHNHPRTALVRCGYANTAAKLFEQT